MIHAGARGAGLCHQLPMHRALCVALALAIGPPAWSANMIPEPSIAELQAKMASGQITAQTLVEHYLQRINALNSQGPALHAVISINPDALAQAHALPMRPWRRRCARPEPSSSARPT